MALTTQRKRLIWRSGFFLLFILAPVLDLFRFDLTRNHFILFGHPWVLGIDGSLSAAELFWNMLIRFFLPIGLLVAGGIWVSWKWGRLYCGWLCPHFSVVEMINALMRRAIGRPTLWDKAQLPERQQDGTQVRPARHWWPVTGAAILLFSLLWAVVLLTYLLPPAEVYGNLFSGTPTRSQAIFIAVATLLLALEFTFARHLFCRFGCAIGLFQSLVWMGNKRAMVVAFDRGRARLCGDCDVSCEHACPMRLKPRSLKRNMFTCTQCMQCIDACERVQAERTGLSLLKLLEQQCALDVSARGLGASPEVPEGCFNQDNRKRRCCTPKTRGIA